jgi:hypothetical protein
MYMRRDARDSSNAKGISSLEHANTLPAARMHTLFCTHISAVTRRSKKTRVALRAASLCFPGRWLAFGATREVAATPGRERAHVLHRTTCVALTATRGEAAVETYGRTPRAPVADS